MFGFNLLRVQHLFTRLHRDILRYRSFARRIRKREAAEDVPHGGGGTVCSPRTRPLSHLRLNAKPSSMLDMSAMGNNCIRNWRSPVSGTYATCSGDERTRVGGKTGTLDPLPESSQAGNFPNRLYVCSGSSGLKNQSFAPRSIGRSISPRLRPRPRSL
jgi:hypothetical protein